MCSEHGGGTRHGHPAQCALAFEVFACSFQWSHAASLTNTVVTCCVWQLGLHAVYLQTLVHAACLQTLAAGCVLRIGARYLLDEACTLRACITSCTLRAWIGARCVQVQFSWIFYFKFLKQSVLFCVVWLQQQKLSATVISGIFSQACGV